MPADYQVDGLLVDGRDLNAERRRQARMQLDQLRQREAEDVAGLPRCRMCEKPIEGEAVDSFLGLFCLDCAVPS